MDSEGLQRLWRLHEIDTGLVEIRKRAAALDPGKAIMAELKALETRSEETGVKGLSGEVADLELKQKGLDDKIKKIDKDLYGGKIVNPREVEAFEKEKEMFRRQRGELDGRLLELYELLPAATETADAINKLI